MRVSSYHDKGFKSRKMIMAYVAMVLITLGFLAIGVWPAMQVAYAEFCVAILSATTIFTGMDTITKAIGAKYSTAAKSDSSLGHQEVGPDQSEKT